MKDLQIIALLQQRSEQAIQALTRIFGPRLYRTALNILSSPEDAQECVNDTYLALWNAIPPAEPDPLAPYVHKTGRNIALKRLRSNTAQKRSAYQVSLDELAECLAGGTLEESVSAKELGRAIDTYLDTLSRENRVIFLRRHWFGDTVKDIAKAMGMSENSVSLRLNRTRAGLREHLAKEGYL